MEDPLSLPLPLSPDLGGDVTNNSFSASYDHDHDHDFDMTRTLVMCFDGTADQFTAKVRPTRRCGGSMGTVLTRRWWAQNTNVVKLYSLFKKEHPEQLCYYQVSVHVCFDILLF